MYKCFFSYEIYEMKTVHLISKIKQWWYTIPPPSSHAFRQTSLLKLFFFPQFPPSEFKLKSDFTFNCSHCSLIFSLRNDYTTTCVISAYHH